MKLSLKIYKVIKSIFDETGIGRFYPIKMIHKFVFNRLKSNSVIIQGHKMFLDSKDSMCLSINGTYEEFETEFIKKNIKQGDIVLDIGANIGYFTLIFAKLVGKNGKVFAFEPDPTNFSLLKKNVEINGYKNIMLINKAVSDKTGKLRLFLCENNNGDHRIYDSKDGRKFIEIESVKLDDYFKNLNDKINFIKIDVQGAENHTVKGMSDLLNKKKNVRIMSEFWPVGLKRSGVEPIEYLKLLIELGFKISEISSKNKIIKNDNINSLLKEYTPKKENFTNILCEKKQI